MLTELRSAFSGLPRPYWTLWWGTFINRMCAATVPFLALCVTGRGGSETQAGWIVALFGAGSTLSGLSGGVLADRVGRRRTMVGSLLGGAAVLAVMATFDSMATLAFGAFSFGFVGDLYRPALNAAVADLVPPVDRERAYGHLYWVHNLGFALAALLGGWLSHSGYRVLFWLDALTALLFALVVLTLVPETRPQSSNGSSRELPRGDWARLFGDRTFLVFCLLNLGVAFVMWQTATALPLHMQHEGLGARDYGLLLSINGALIVVLQPPLGVRLRQLPRTLVLTLAALTFGTGFGLHGVAHDPWDFAFAIVLWTLGEIALLPISSSVAADLAPPDLRGRYQGLFSMSWSIASCAGPIIGTRVIQELGHRAIWVLCFAIMLCVASGHAALGPERGRRERR